jgi:prepilin-type N-terminal cleavage/methylation domain-containing protein
MTGRRTGPERSGMIDTMCPRRFKRKGEGFSLIEVMLGVALLAIAVLGLAQLFLLSLYNNARADQISNATFLAQQQLDNLRSLNAAELGGLGATPIDEQIDVNNDGQYDYRRITRLTPGEFDWRIEVWVFSAAEAGIPAATLINNPQAYRVRASFGTVISR